MPKQREWTERDVQMLREMYRLREMTKEQLLRRYFSGGNEGYGSKRLHVLKQEGLVISEVHGARKNGRMLRTAYYRLTEQGLRFLRERGVIEDYGDRARDLKWSTKQRELMLDMNELHLSMPDIAFSDSRAIKRKYSMNRGDRVVGGFNVGEGDYLVYILTANAQEDTLIKIIEEIRKPKPIQGHLVYAKSSAVKRHFERLCEQQKLVTGGVPMHVLSLDALGVGITRHYILLNGYSHLQELLADHGKLSRVKDRSKYGFWYGMRPLTSIEAASAPYVIELLTGNILMLKRCLSAYNRDRSEREGRRILLICWDTEIELYRQELIMHTHIDLLGIPRSAVESHFKRLGG